MKKEYEHFNKAKKYLMQGNKGGVNIGSLIKNNKQKYSYLSSTGTKEKDREAMSQMKEGFETAAQTTAV